MALASSEVRLLRAIRKIYAADEPLFSKVCDKYFESYDISLDFAMDSCEKYFEGSHTAYRVARDRLSRKIDEANSGRGFWGWSFLMDNGYKYWSEIPLGNGYFRFGPGNVSEKTFKNWCVLATMAYIDRIIETGEVT